MKSEIDEYTEYDVAISYSSEDTELADVIANRLRQDGLRCFYNPNRLHKLLGLDISDSLRKIYSCSQTFVVALVSSAYMRKKYPMEELESALSKGAGNLILVKINGAKLPEHTDGISYSEYILGITDPYLIATHISQALSQRTKL